MQIKYEMKQPIELIGPHETTNLDGETIQHPRKLSAAWVQKVFGDNGNLIMEGERHRSGPVPDTDLDSKSHAVAMDGTERTRREIWKEAERMTGTTLM